MAHKKMYTWILLGVLVLLLMIISGPYLKNLTQEIDIEVAKEEARESPWGQLQEDFLAQRKDINEKYLGEKATIGITEIQTVEDLENKKTLEDILANLETLHDLDAQYYEDIIALVSQTQENLPPQPAEGDDELLKGFAEGFSESLEEHAQSFPLIQDAEVQAYVGHRNYYQFILKHQKNFTFGEEGVSMKTADLQKEHDDLLEKALFGEEYMNQLVQKLQE